MPEERSASRGDQRWARFRFSVIGPLLAAPPQRGELRNELEGLAARQWVHRRFFIKTLTDLEPEEVVHGPFAQIIRYEGQHRSHPLGSSTFDLYKICLQDHAIINTLAQQSDLHLFPFVLYIITHELIHIVRFSKFLQIFDAPAEERMSEEKRVHARTHDILQKLQLDGLPVVLKFYDEWRIPYDGMKST